MTDEIPEDFKQLYASITLPTTTDDEFQIALKMYEACKAKWCVGIPSDVESRKAFEAAHPALDLRWNSITGYSSRETRLTYAGWQARGAELAIYKGRDEAKLLVINQLEAQLEAANAKVAELGASLNATAASLAKEIHAKCDLRDRLAAIDAEVGPDLATYSFDGEGIYSMPAGVGQYVLTHGHKHRAEQLAAKVLAWQKRTHHLIGVLRRDGYWAALMTDEEVIKQIDQQQSEGETG